MADGGKVVRSYEAHPRPVPDAGGYHLEERAGPAPWTDGRIQALLKMYGVEQKGIARDGPRKILRRIEVAVEYLFGRKRRTGGPRKKRMKRKPEPEKGEKS
jgi:hypothetical protein